MQMSRSPGRGRKSRLVALVRQIQLGLGRHRKSNDFRGADVGHTCHSEATTVRQFCCESINSKVEQIIYARHQELLVMELVLVLGLKFKPGCQAYETIFLLDRKSVV